MRQLSDEAHSLTVFKSLVEAQGGLPKKDTNSTQARRAPNPNPKLKKMRLKEVVVKVARSEKRKV